MINISHLFSYETTDHVSKINHSIGVVYITKMMISYPSKNSGQQKKKEEKTQMLHFGVSRKQKRNLVSL